MIFHQAQVRFKGRNFRKIAEGLDGAEGPVVNSLGEILAVSSRAGTVVKARRDLKVEVICHTGGVPAGLQFDPMGNLWCADMKRGLLRIEANGSVTSGLPEDTDPRAFESNDLSFDDRGNLYFTAPGKSNLSNPCGCLFCIPRGTANAILMDDSYAFSNGIAVTPDGTILYVAETQRKIIWKYFLSEAGMISSKMAFAHLSREGPGGPDGIDLDAEGNLLVADYNGSRVWVVAPSGSMEAFETFFAKCTNLHFMGSQSNQLVITDSTNGCIWETEWRCGGISRCCDSLLP